MAKKHNHEVVGVLRGPGVVHIALRRDCPLCREIEKRIKDSQKQERRNK